MTTALKPSLFIVAVLSLMACNDNPVSDTMTMMGPVAMGGAMGGAVGGAAAPDAGAPAAPTGPSAMTMPDMPPLAGAGGSNSPAPPDASTPPANQGDVQRCVYATGCLEFRMHRVGCQTGNEANCKSVFGGTYEIGACDASMYPMMPTTTDTSCGPTVVFNK